MTSQRDDRPDLSADARMTSDTRLPSKLETNAFLLIVAIISLAFAWVIEPFFGALLWSLVAVILFTPLYRRLQARWHRRNMAAGATLLVIIVLIIVPTVLLTAAMLQEASMLYAKLQSGQIDPAELFRRLQGALPDWALSMLQRFGITDFGALQTMIEQSLTRSARSLAGQALVISQSAASFVIALGVMLYVTFFLLKDGDRFSRRIADAAPLHPAHREALVDQFVTVIRATVKGTIVVAIVQGALGGLIFWLLGIEGALLWGVVMGFLSLVPAVGTAIVWVPVAIYLFATGQVWQAVVLAAFGVFIIGLVDNILRPILVGRDARMPDFLVLVTTLGGLEVFGISGFVVGPVIAALFLAVWDLFARTRHDLPVGQPR